MTTAKVRVTTPIYVIDEFAGVVLQGSELGRSDGTMVAVNCGGMLRLVPDGDVFQDRRAALATLVKRLQQQIDFRVEKTRQAIETMLAEAQAEAVASAPLTTTS